MLRELLSKVRGKSSDSYVDALSFQEPQLRLLAASLLSDDHGALLPLSFEDATTALLYMQERDYSANDVVFTEGESRDLGYMLMVIHGDVQVHTVEPNGVEPVALRVLTSGAIVGELALMDGGPRSTTCVAATDVTCAQLTRTAFKQLLQDHPQVAAKLLLLVGKRIAERTRDVTAKLKISSQLSKTLMQELAAAS